MFIGLTTDGAAVFYNEAEEKTEQRNAADFSVQGQLTVGAEIGKKPFCLQTNETALLFSESCLTDVLGERPDKLCFYGFYQAVDHTAAYENLLLQADAAGYDISFSDYAGDNAAEKALMTLVTVFSYGFITLISLIAAANVFNTVFTNIMLRRRELAMLRSVGLSPKGMNRMMIYESLLYGFKSLVFGLPVSLILTVIIYMIVSDSGFSMGFSLPYAQIGFAVLTVFAIVIATMLYSVNKIKKYNTADELKNENL